MLTTERSEKLKALAANRQPSLTIILENVHDPHNLGAVLRTCDSVGIVEIHALYTIESKFKLKAWTGHRSSSGAKKWVQVHYHDNVDDCFAAVRQKHDKIYGTHLAEDTVSLYKLDMVQSMALLFGNEHRGVSDEALAQLDGNFLIPQVGLTKSLNISVACAVSLYEAKRQRLVAGMYGQPFDTANVTHQQLYDKYVHISRPPKLT